MKMRELAIRLAIAVAGPAAALAAGPGVPLPPTEPIPAAQAAAPECWLTHAQVQPAPEREAVAGGGQDFDARYRALAGTHAGAEHPTAERLRPCAARSPTEEAAAGKNDARR